MIDRNKGNADVDGIGHLMSYNKQLIHHVRISYLSITIIL